MEFIENKGQWDQRVKFMSNTGSGAFFLTDKGFTVSQYSPDDMENLHAMRHGLAIADSATVKRLRRTQVRAHAYSVEFLHAQKAQIIPDKALQGVTNYFIGNDPSRWASDCKIYLGVTYKNIYDGIDLRYYVDEANNLKYDIIVNPGARVEDIAMKYSGANKVDVKNKELRIATALGVNKELIPHSYQVTDNRRQEVDCRYVVKDSVVRFKVKNYSRNTPLIIDPTEIFFSYSGSTSENWGFTATYGPDGSFYGGGIVFGQGFPHSNGYDQTFNGSFDIAIIKLSPDGRNMIYTTYIGGNAEEQPHSLIVDPKGELILAGRSNSPDYPTTATLGNRGGWDIVVTKLNASGGALIGSMKIGGSNADGVNIADETQGGGTKSLKRNYGDDARSEVLLDDAGNIYLASCTSSSDFPTTAGALQRSKGGSQDAVILKLNPGCNTVLFSTFLGGKGDDAAYVLVLDKSNNIYVAGGTGSNDFPGISPGALNAAYMGGDCDGFITQINSTGTAIIRGTYIGTSAADQIYGIETDKNGFVYVMGTSEGNMPVINAAYSNPGTKQFISKIEPDLSKYVYSTVFGSVNSSSYPNISPTAFLVDRCENVYVSGWGGKSNVITQFGTATTRGMPVTPNALKPQTDASGSDFYFFVLEKNAASQLYGTFFGQEDPGGVSSSPQTFGDHVDGGTSRFDRNGVIYQAICANCYKSVAFPGTPGAWSVRNRAASPPGIGCSLAMVKIEMDFTGVRSGLQASIEGRANDTSGCIPLQVNFSDTLKKGKLYYWYFGDGTGDTTTVPASSHLYTATGTYQVMLVSIDSATCNVSDTSYTHIKAGNNKAVLQFTSQKIPPCTNLSYNFTNTSTASSGSFKPDAFTWDFGDGSPLVTQGLTPPIVHSYAGKGTYQVTLTLNDTSYCNFPDDTMRTIRLSPLVEASFSTPASGCVPYNAVFDNTSLGGLNFEWDFGDGTTSTDENPTHLYGHTGVYTVRLIAYDSTSCNKADTTRFTITVSDVPFASFTYNPLVPAENTFTNFINQSTGATGYLWNFDDGDTSTLKDPKHIFAATAIYNVCLTASNQFGCSDDTCIDVRSLIRPLVDVPTAFTPGKFGTNSIIRVAGFGIREMHWVIYNRWGQKVYESNSFKGGWDGTFRGRPQPVDVYSYTLDVTFTDDTKARKTGDITLLR